MNEGLDRRRSPRHEVRVFCQAVRERDFKLLAETSLDLSSAGMLLRTPMRVLTGDRVIVSFLEPSESRWYDAQATVARVPHGRRTGELGRCVALEFHSLDAAAEERLRAALKATVRELQTGGRVDDSVAIACDSGFDTPADCYGTYSLVM